MPQRSRSFLLYLAFLAIFGALATGVVVLAWFVIG